jgi:YggT family protein
MVAILIRLVNLLANLFVLVVFVDSILSFFLSPYHPVRSALDRFLEPFLSPIRRMVPMVGAFDFSPLVLIVLIEVVAFVLTGFLNLM